MRPASVIAACPNGFPETTGRPAVGPCGRWGQGWEQTLMRAERPGAVDPAVHAAWASSTRRASLAAPWCMPAPDHAAGHASRERAARWSCGAASGRCESGSFPSSAVQTCRAHKHRHRHRQRHRHRHTSVTHGSQQRFHSPTSAYRWIARDSSGCWTTRGGRSSMPGGRLGSSSNHAFSFAAWQHQPISGVNS